MKTYNYDYTDKVLKQLKRKIAKRFSEYKSLVGFDELNLLQRATDMFDGLESDAEEAYLNIAKHYARELDQEKIITKKWLNGYLTSYNPITTYQYKHEVDRKKYRMFEAYMATKALMEIDKCMKLWTLQVTQASDDITDLAIIDSAKETGYKWVMWMTEEDDKVCSECAPRDRKIYPINKIPDKPHYHCRCIIIPLTEEDKKILETEPVED